jgi:hypothetical protein
MNHYYNECLIIMNEGAKDKRCGGVMTVERETPLYRHCEPRHGA